MAVSNWLSPVFLVGFSVLMLGRPSRGEHVGLCKLSKTPGFTYYVYGERNRFQKNRVIIFVTFLRLCLECIYSTRYFFRIHRAVYIKGIVIHNRSDRLHTSVIRGHQLWNGYQAVRCSVSTNKMPPKTEVKNGSKYQRKR